MIVIFLSFFLVQAAAPPGAVSGIVRSAAGTPAAGVRVYAQQVRDTADTNSPAPLEGLAQTDASGRYRLELPPGRYYIASGSVSAPTYYPDTTNIASAKLVTVISAATTEGIDFGSFIPASSRPAGLAGINVITAPVGFFGGTVLFSDGAPASNARVVAYPASTTALPAAVLAGPISPLVTQTNSAGRYGIGNVPLGEYLIVAGYAETSAFFADPNRQARTIKLTSPTRIDSLDIDLPLSPTRTGISVAGTVIAKDGVPASGALVRISGARSNSSTGVLPSIDAVPDTSVTGDGTFKFTNVVPGSYIVQVSFSNVNRGEAVEVGNSSVTNLQFSLPVAMAGGRIVFEDGTSVPDPDLFVSGMLSTVGNPNLILSTILPISAGGVFGGVPDKGELRFYFRSLPEEYEIRSIMAGSVDLTKETLKFDGTQSFFIETRVARRTANSPYSSVQVGGTVRDASGAIPPAGRVELCCRDTGPAEAFSAPVRADGSFQFSGVPPGKYTPRLSVAGQGAIIGAVSATVGVLSGARDRVRLQLVVGSTGTPLVPVAIEIPTPR